MAWAPRISFRELRETRIVAKLVSGGQTGVDRAALDTALALGIACGGWCPRGRRAEDGPIPDRYPLTESPSPFYPERTERNVRDSDGTLVLTRGRPQGGTALTLRLLQRERRPFVTADLAAPPDPAPVREWIARHGIRTLNVAGPRESESPGIHAAARAFLEHLLRD